MAIRPESQFWKWFNEHEDELFHFESERDPIFRSLSDALERYDDGLTFEVGPVEDGRRELVISADGMRESFPAVVTLCESAPELPRWKVIQFRPRRAPIDTIHLKDLTLSPEDVWVTLQPDENKAGITLYMKGYCDELSSSYSQIGYLFLDEALGEFDVENRVGFVEFREAGAESEFQKKELKDLPSVFDQFVRYIEGE
jgi:hypothetical protein